MNSIKEIMTNGDLWTALGGLSMVGLAIILWIPMIVRKTKLRLKWLLLCVAGIFCGTAGMLAFAPHPQDAVVRQDGAPVLLSPFKNAEPQAKLALGDHVRIVKHHGEYVYVHTSAGAHGWIAADQLDRFVQL